MSEGGEEWGEGKGRGPKCPLAGVWSWGTGLPWWLRWWRICLQCRRPGFSSWVGKILWRRAWEPTPVFLPGESPLTEEPGELQFTGLDTTEWLSTARSWGTVSGSNIGLGASAYSCNWLFFRQHILFCRQNFLKLGLRQRMLGRIESSCLLCHRSS